MVTEKCTLGKESGAFRGKDSVSLFKHIYLSVFTGGQELFLCYILHCNWEMSRLNTL